MAVQRGLMPSIKNGGATATKVRNDAVEAANVALKLGAEVTFWEAGANGARVDDRMQAAGQLFSAALGAMANEPMAMIIGSNQGGEAFTGAVDIQIGDTLFIVGAVSECKNMSWVKDGTPINDTTRVTGTKTPVLRIDNVTDADNGIYQLAAVQIDESRVDSQTYAVSNIPSA